MDYLPLDNYERKVIKILQKQDKHMYDKTVKATRFNLKQNSALDRLCDLGLAFRSDLTRTGIDVYGLTDLGKRTIIHVRGERFWRV